MTFKTYKAYMLLVHRIYRCLGEVSDQYLKGTFLG